MKKILDKMIIYLGLLTLFSFPFNFAQDPPPEQSTEPSLVVPKGYSNLRIPGGRRKSHGGSRHGGGAAYGVPFQPRLTTFSLPVANKTENGFPAPPPPLDTTPILAGQAVFTPPPVVQWSNGTGDNETVPVKTLNRETDYDWVESSGILPPATDNDPAADAIAVDLAMQVQSIREIDEANQKIILEIDLTVHWKDYDYLPEDESYVPDDPENVSWLLKTYKAEPIAVEEFEKLWKPDIFIERVVKVTKPGLLAPPVAIRVIRAASSIVYTTRASVKVDCSMNFQYYPADTQNCILDLRSYQNDETKLKLRWNPVPGAYLVNADSDDNFDIQLAYVAQRKKKVKDINLDDAIFDVLQLKFSMRRRMTYHLLQTYIPSAFLVFITWLTFLIPEDLIEGRIGISMTTLLTLTAMFAAVRENTPVVSYIKAIDIWMVYCIFIVFATLLEFTFFVWLRNYKLSNREKKLQNLISEGPLTLRDGKDHRPGQPRLTLDDVTSKAVVAFEHSAKVLNQFAFGFFVLNFVIFCVIYWPWLIVASEHAHWSVNSTLNGHPGDTNGGFIDEL